MTIGVDVGNTALKVAFENEPNVIIRRVSDPTTIDALAHALASRSRPGAAVEVRIASVNRSAATQLIERTEAIAGAGIAFRRITRNDVPIPIATDHPDRVGIDRVVGAFGAACGYPYPLVVVDAGTTVTVDLVDAAGVYRGGAIIPGLEMQTAALGAGTDALPHIDWNSSCASSSGASHSITGTNTIAAIRLGVLSAIVGGIERLVRLYGNPENVVITGGDSECLVDELSRHADRANRSWRIHHHPHLVCRTLAELP